jgi:hypothetical protein
MMLNNIQLYRGVQFYFGENRSARRKPPSRRKLLILSRNVVIEYTSPWSVFPNHIEGLCGRIL